MADFATPSRPISRDQFASLRYRVAKDSPSLYKNKVLSNPDEQLNVEKNSRKSMSETSKLQIPPNTSTSRLNSSQVGSFENPVLHKLAQRTVNKEWETQRLVVNIIAWALWNLLTRLCSTLSKHSQASRKWLSWIKGEVLRYNCCNGVIEFFKRSYDRYPSIWNKINWSNINFLFHVTVIINILFSIWKLLSKVKTDDLQLSENQKRLLGVVGQYNDDSDESIKDFELVSTHEAKKTPPEPPNTPYLFKSLETPMKSREKQEANSITFKGVGSQNTLIDRINAFGLPNTNAKNVGTELFPSNLANTPVSKTGYIPSSKYTYLMNSPTPRKST